MKKRKSKKIIKEKNQKSRIVGLGRGKWCVCVCVCVHLPWVCEGLDQEWWVGVRCCTEPIRFSFRFDLDLCLRYVSRGVFILPRYELYKNKVMLDKYKVLFVKRVSVLILR